MLASVSEIKERADGESVTFRARALRFWDIGGTRMCLAGDESALTRVEVGDAELEEGRSYEFRGAVVKHYSGGWTSASIVDVGEAVAMAADVPISQDEAYIERTFKILTGIQRKRAREEGRVPPWRHPSERGE